MTGPALVIASYVAGGLLVVGACAVVLVRDPVRGVQALAFTLLAAAVLFLVLSGVVVFAVQVVAAAAVAGIGWLALRGIRGASRRAEPLLRWQWLAAGAVSAAVLLLVSGVVVTTSWPSTSPEPAESVARSLMTQYLVALGIFGILLISAVAGAGALYARDEEEQVAPDLPAARPPRRRGRRAQVAPRPDGRS